MNIKLSNTLNSIKNNINKNSPQILVGLGIAGMIGSTILAVKVTPKAVELLKEEKEKTNLDDLDLKTTFLTTWKLYIPSFITGALSVGCIIGGTCINKKRHAALAMAYSLSERSYRTYRDKVIETIGERKEKKIRDEIAQEGVSTDEKRQIIITPKGQTLLKDSISGRYFRSDLDTLRKAMNELNREMTHQNYISLNRFYSTIGLDGIKNGDYIGWNIDRGLIEFEFSTCITDTDEPCIVVGYTVDPKEGFDRY